ncbi:hypothetical protein D3C80_1462350 [compost metagenome]
MNILVRAADGLVQTLKIIICPARLHIRHPRYDVEPPPHLQMLPVHPAASVPVSVSKQQLAVQVFVAVGVPDALNSKRFH